MEQVEHIYMCVCERKRDVILLSLLPSLWLLWEHQILHCLTGTHCNKYFMAINHETNHLASLKSSQTSSKRPLKSVLRFIDELQKYHRDKCCNYRHCLSLEPQTQEMR